MDSTIINAILAKEKSLNNPITKDNLLEHMDNIEQIRVNHLSLVEKAPSHDPHKHGAQIVRYAKEIANDFGCSAQESALIACAARFHDIGKTRIDNEILNKPFKLSQEEYEEIKQHTIYGQELMYPLKYLSNLVRHHHERFDGKGYPDGLKGNEIPLGSRIISAIDAFNAMTHKRSYNKPMKIEEAIHELKKNSGTQFDPKVIKSFISVLNTTWLKKNIDFVKA